jgi:hypothetical protein
VLKDAKVLKVHKVFRVYRALRESKVLVMVDLLF